MLNQKEDAVVGLSGMKPNILPPFWVSPGSTYKNGQNSDGMDFQTTSIVH